MTDPSFPGGHPDEGTLDRWRTGEISEAEAARVVEHVAACAACARAAGELEAFAAVVGRAYAADRELAVEEEPDWSRVREEIARATHRAGAPAAAPSRRTRWSRWAPQTAAAVIALIVVGVLWREGVRGPEDVERLVGTEEPAVQAPAANAPTLERDATTATDGTGSEAAAQRAPMGADTRAPVSADRDEAAAERRNAEGVQDALADRARAAGEQAPAAPPPREEALSAQAAELERQDRADQAKAEAAVTAAALDPHDRFASQARSALIARDTLAASRTLALWRDTLSPRNELDDALRAQAQALADSLSSLLETPAQP